MTQKSAISFGLVHIPIRLHTATQDNDISFNQLHKDDHARIRYKKTCAHCGNEIKQSDIVKGFEYEKEKYVIVTDDDFEKIKTEKNRAMQILHFTILNTISPIFYDKTYHSVPEPGGERAFELLRQAMMQEQVVAVAKTVLGTKETLLTLIPREDGLLAQTMFFADEIKALPQNYNKPEAVKAELAMAQQLIASMTKPFAPEEYKDEYQAKLRELIAAKIAGKEVVAAANEQISGENIINLMEALKASIELNQTPPKDKRTRKKKGA